MTVQDKMKRLDEARAKVDAVTRRKERLSGELDAKKKRVEELEQKARDQFECEVEEIPDIVEKLDAEATEALKKAEAMLGLGQADDEDAL